MSHLVELEGVVKHYRGATEEVCAVDGVSLSIERGELVALEGPSGSGKTTLLRLIARLYKPDRGVVRFDGRDLSSFTEHEVCDYLYSDIGFIHQGSGPHLMPRVSAIDNAATKLQMGGLKAREARACVAPWLDRVGLSHRLDFKTEQLSGGERQRVAIVRALALSPRLILADEPTAHLASEGSHQIAELLRTVAHEQGAAVLLVTHDPAIAAVADRRCTLRDGKLS